MQTAYMEAHAAEVIVVYSPEIAVFAGESARKACGKTSMRRTAFSMLVVPPNGFTGYFGGKM